MQSEFSHQKCLLPSSTSCIFSKSQEKRRSFKGQLPPYCFRTEHMLSQVLMEFPRALFIPKKTMTVARTSSCPLWSLRSSYMQKNWSCLDGVMEGVWTLKDFKVFQLPSVNYICFELLGPREGTWFDPSKLNSFRVHSCSLSLFFRFRFAKLQSWTHILLFIRHYSF